MFKEVYTTIKTELMIKVTTTNITIFKNMYVELGEEGKEKKLYMFMNMRERKTQNLDQMKSTKNKKDEVLVE